MSSLAVTFPGETLIIQPWPDPSPGGHDPRSPYVEQFWLSILGPTSTDLGTVQWERVRPVHGP